MKFLSYILDTNTPSYGNKDSVALNKVSSIARGDIANNTHINTTLHIGTHIDMPCHFYDNAQDISHFDGNFWIFNKVLFLEIIPKDTVIKNELIEKLKTIKDIGYEILVVKTGICHMRNKMEFQINNFGFDPEVYNFLSLHFPNIRVFGFDSISVSSFKYREIGRKAHFAFLNPKKPILLLEDMDLRKLDNKSVVSSLIIAPLRVSEADGLPCTVLAEF